MRVKACTDASDILLRSISRAVHSPVVRFRLSDGVAMALTVYAFRTDRISLVVVNPYRPSSAAKSKGSSVDRLIDLAVDVGSDHVRDQPVHATGMRGILDLDATQFLIR